ncbi:hypothetical protein [Streptomyces atratus]|uniref:hypothetical protein n=1 Tax=Streptomyces atratus TaxID=1893 RepID=UPI002F9089F7
MSESCLHSDQFPTTTTTIEKPLIIALQGSGITVNLVVQASGDSQASSVLPGATLQPPVSFWTYVRRVGAFLAWAATVGGLLVAIAPFFR